MRNNNKQQLGLALSAILLAVVLLTVIAITIALSERSLSGNSSQQSARLAAAAVINTAQNIKTGFDRGMANGMDAASLTFDNAAGTGIFNPSVGGALAQMLVGQASIDVTRLYWVYHGAGALIKLMNVGSGAGSYVLEYDPLTKAACGQINLMLYNDSAIPTLSSAAVSAWWHNSGPNVYGATATLPVDASSDPAVNGRPEGCVFLASSPKYLYYKSVLDN